MLKYLCITFLVFYSTPALAFHPIKAVKHFINQEKNCHWQSVYDTAYLTIPALLSRSRVRKGISYLLAPTIYMSSYLFQQPHTLLTTFETLIK